MISYVNRPEDLECKSLWELYVLLDSLDKPYLKARRWGKDQEYLYYIQSISRPEGVDRYTNFGCDDIYDLEIPDGREEWIEIVLLRKECGKEIEFKCKVKTNTKYNSDFSVFTLMTLSRISIPDISEINAAYIDHDRLPVT